MIDQDYTLSQELIDQYRAEGFIKLKNVFDGAAVTVMMGSSSLRRYYDRLRSKGIRHSHARRDVARKVSSICLSILKTGKKFDDNFEEKSKRKRKKQV